MVSVRSLSVSLVSLFRNFVFGCSICPFGDWWLIQLFRLVKSWIIPSCVLFFFSSQSQLSKVTNEYEESKRRIAALEEELAALKLSAT